MTILIGVVALAATMLSVVLILTYVFFVEHMSEPDWWLVIVAAWISIMGSALMMAEVMG